MINESNVLYAAANLIALTSKDIETNTWISKKERAYLYKIAEHEKIDHKKGKLDTELVEHYLDSFEREKAVIEVLKNSPEELQMKAMFYMEKMADVDLEEGLDNMSDKEADRIRRIEQGIDFNRIRYEARKPSIEQKCAHVML